MLQRKCCVSNCKSSLIEGAVLHSFPNPSTDSERFQTWVTNAGLVGEEDHNVYGKRRICHLHFEQIYHYPKNRLNRLAIPTLYLPGDQSNAHSNRPMPGAMRECQPSTSDTSNMGFIKSDQPDAQSNRPMPMAMDECQPSTSGTSNIGLTKSDQPDAHSNRPMTMAMGECQPTASGTSRIGLTKRPQFKHQDDMELYRTVIKTQNELIRCKKTKAGLIQKLKVARKFMHTEAYQLVTKKLSPAAKLFFDMQIRQSVKHPKGHRFTLDEKILALSLYKPSPKAYRLLSQFCVLPKKSTLNKLMSKIYLKTGINEIIFEHLKKRVGKMPNSHQYCTLIFDEMAIAAHLSYDKHRDEIKGFSDNGSERRKCFADHALVFMVRGIFKKYKQPVAFSFCTGATTKHDLKHMITEVIKKILATGLKVISTTCDQGSSNMAAINMMINDTKAQYLRQGKEFKGGYFEVENEQIYPIYDPPHLLKGIRNNLITKNLQFEKDGKKFVAKWAHIEALYKKGPGFKGMRLVPKLTARHAIPSIIPKMRVKYCTQLFSKTVSVAMGFTAGTGRIPRESTDTAELLMFFDMLFDSVNGNYNKIEKGKVYRSAVTPKSPHHKLWHKSLHVLKSMKFVSGRMGTVPSISSWIKTIQAFQQITKKLHSEGLRSLLLRNFNQDPLENFFGAIRAHGHRNVMPTSTSFEASYKTLLINNLASPKSIGANCEGDDGYCLQSLKYFLTQNITRPLPKSIYIVPEHLNIELPQIDCLLNSKEPSDLEKCAAAAYCCGWLIKIIHQSNESKNCTDCIKDLEGDSEAIFAKFITMKKNSNRCILHYPSKSLLECLLHVEEITIEVLKTSCESNQILNYIELIASSLVSLNFVTCEIHKCNLKKYILRKAIALILQDWCREINNILSGKSTVWDTNDPIKQSAHSYFVRHKLKK